MAFRFVALLKLRKSLEHQQELRLRAANQWVARVRELMRLSETSMAALARTQAASLDAGTAAAELHFLSGHAAACEVRWRELSQQLGQAENVRDQQRQVLFRIREQREMLESLKIGEDHERLRRASRQDQSQMDEAFLLRQHRRKEN